MNGAVTNLNPASALTFQSSALAGDKAASSPASPNIADIQGVSSKPNTSADTSSASEGKGSEVKDTFSAVLQNRLKATTLGKPAKAPAQPSASIDAAKLSDDLLKFCDAITALETKTDTKAVADKTDDPLSNLSNLVNAPSSTDAVAAPNSVPVSDTTALPATLTALPALPASQNLAPTPSVTPPPTQPKTDQPNKILNTVVEEKPAAIFAGVDNPSSELPAKHDDIAGGASFKDLLRAPSTANNTSAQLLIDAQTRLTATAPVTLPTRDVQTQVGTAQWANDVGNQLSWMVNQRESRADLVLNPPDLGRIEVSITLKGDQASATFVSANTEVRDALQGSLPRLKEILADSGVFLGQTSVGMESFRHSGNDAEKGSKSGDDSFSSSTRNLLGSTTVSAPSASPWVSRGNGLVDLFA